MQEKQTSDKTKRNLDVVITWIVDVHQRVAENVPLDDHAGGVRVCGAVGRVWGVGLRVLHTHCHLTAITQHINTY